MNCTEVGELMQRNLDYDLSESELATLMTHLSDCAQCTVLFEKLTLLSGSLEQLPRVTPSISIVDAILPELERIDNEKRNSLIIAKQRRNRWLTTVGSIATAAAIVVLMVNLNGIPGTSNSTSSDLAMKINAKNDIGPEPAAAQIFTNEEETDMAADSPGKVRTTDEIGQYSSSVAPNINGQSSDASGGLEEYLEVGSTTIAPAIPNIRKEITTEKPKDSSSSAFVPELTGSLTENVDKLGVLNELATTIQEQTVNDSGASVERYPSKDEKFYLQFEEHTISVYETSSNQIVQQWEVPKQGLFEFIEWDNEGTFFTFQITDETGMITSYAWKLNAQQ